jgi:hypothetical protein
VNIADFSFDSILRGYFSAQSDTELKLSDCILEACNVFAGVEDELSPDEDEVERTPTPRLSLKGKCTCSVMDCSYDQICASVSE